MIIFTTNTSIFALPVLLAIWALDLYLLLAAIPLILSRISGDRPNHWCMSLRQFTDPIPMAIHRWLMRRRTTPIPGWMPWLIVILGCLVLRHLLIWTALKTL